MEKFKTFVLLQLNILVVLNVTGIYSEYLLIKFFYPLPNLGSPSWARFPKVG